MTAGLVVSGRYRLLNQVRAGGMGTIWRARHLELGTLCVVKVLHASLENDPQARERFRREAQVALRVHHPNVVRFFDYVTEGSATYLVMEYIVGVDLSQFTRAAGLVPLPVALEIARQALAALGALHARGIVHRDVSPDNMMLTEEPEGALTVKVVDLGLAKQAAERSLTETGTFMGKLKYGAPEQLGPRRKDGIDGRADLYSLSVVLYQLLTGRPPFESQTPGGWVYAHLSEPPTPFEVSDPSGLVPDDVRRAVLHGLEKDPAWRFLDAASYAAALAKCQERAGRAGLPEAVDQVRKLIRRESRFIDAAAPAEPGPEARPGRAGTAATWLLLGSLALLAGALWLARTPPLPRTASPSAPAAVNTPRTAASTATTPLSQGPPPGPEVQLAFTASPDATLDSVFSEREGRSIPVENALTPLSLSLPPGRYRLRATFEGSGQRAESLVDVRPGRLQTAHVTAPSFDVNALVSQYVP